MMPWEKRKRKKKKFLFSPNYYNIQQEAVTFPINLDNSNWVAGKLYIESSKPLPLQTPTLPVSPVPSPPSRYRLARQTRSKSISPPQSSPPASTSAVTASPSPPAPPTPVSAK